MPAITTPRLLLRPIEASDLERVVALAGEWEVASRTTDIPYPFEPETAQAWVAPAADEVRCAILSGDHLIGAIGYFVRCGGAGELGFWIGRPWWGQGFATEAARALLDGPAARRLPAFSAAHFADNPASGRVLAKLGFAPIGESTAPCRARGGLHATVEHWLEVHPDRRAPMGTVTGWLARLRSLARPQEVDTR